MNPWSSPADLQRDAPLAAALLSGNPWKEPPRPKSIDDVFKEICGPDVGGNWTLSMAHSEYLPVGAAVRIVVDPSAASPVEEPFDVPAKLMAIQHRLTLNTTQLAKVLRVERPTIYAWMGEDSTPHPANLNRLNAIFEVAMAWQRLSPDPLGLSVREPLDGLSILQLLENDHIAGKALMRRMEVFAAQQRQKRALRPPSAVDLMRQHNFAPMPEWMVRENIRSLSRK